jgi:biopolymer transport protein ExbD
MSTDPPEVNLIPLLDMVSLLIQMLLVNAQFGTFAELGTQVAGANAEQNAERLGFEVDVGTDGYQLSWTENGARTTRLVPCHGKCEKPEDWDALGLRLAAVGLKQSHAEEQQVILSPAKGVPFEAVVRAMDAVRSDAAGAPVFPDLVIGP